MVFCLISTPAVGQQRSSAFIPTGFHHLRVHRDFVKSTLTLRARATRWQRQGAKRQQFRVHADSKGFGQRPQAPQHKGSKQGSTVKKANIPQSEKQDAAPSHAPQSQQNQQTGARDQEEVPEVVNDRMLKRIIAFCGIPVFTGFLLFPFFYYLKVTQHVDLPMSVVYIVQLLTFGGGFFGITYGILSASWDPRREGSLLGITEFKANLPLILDRVKSRGGKGRV